MKRCPQCHGNYPESEKFCPKDGSLLESDNRGATYVICEPCIGTKDTACVDVCPPWVDCIHPRKDEDDFEASEMLFINPDECIDCGACQPACPVEAIFRDEEVPEKWQSYIQVNADHYK